MKPNKNIPEYSGEPKARRGHGGLNKKCPHLELKEAEYQEALEEIKRHEIANEVLREKIDYVLSFEWAHTGTEAGDYSKLKDFLLK